MPVTTATRPNPLARLRALAAAAHAEGFTAEYVAGGMGCDHVRIDFDGEHSLIVENWSIGTDWNACVIPTADYEAWSDGFTDTMGWLPAVPESCDPFNALPALVSLADDATR